MLRLVAALETLSNCQVPRTVPSLDPLESSHAIEPSNLQCSHHPGSQTPRNREVNPGWGPAQLPSGHGLTGRSKVASNFGARCGGDSEVTADNFDVLQHKHQTWDVNNESTSSTCINLWHQKNNYNLKFHWFSCLIQHVAFIA